MSWELPDPSRRERDRSIFIMSTLSSYPAMGSFDCFGFGVIADRKLNTTRGSEKAADEGFRRGLVGWSTKQEFDFATIKTAFVGFKH